MMLDMKAIVIIVECILLRVSIKCNNKHYMLNIYIYIYIYF